MAAAAAAECEWAGKSEGVAVVGKSGSGRTSQGSAQPQLIYIPSRRKVGRGWMGGGGEWVGMPVEEKKNHILQLQNSSSRLTAQRVTAVHSVDQCVLSTGAYWTCSLM